MSSQRGKFRNLVTVVELCFYVCVCVCVCVCDVTCLLSALFCNFVFGLWFADVHCSFPCTRSILWFSPFIRSDRFQCSEMLSLLLTPAPPEARKRLPSHTNMDLAASVREEASLSLQQHKGDWPCYFFTQLTTFTLPAGQCSNPSYPLSIGSR